MRYLTYWYDARACNAFCLVDAPDAETAKRVHAESHGLLPSDIIEVDMTVVEAFLGRITDPAATIEKGTPIDESAHRVIMFTDIVNSTEMTARLGDARAMDLVRCHDSVVRRELAAHSGREVKHLGDGIMAAFACPHAAVKCACSVLRGVRDFNAASSEQLQLRIGMHAGEPVNESNDLFGATVQMAARICADASVDAVVISDEIRAALGDAFQLMPLGKRMLKGFHQPAPLYAVEWG